MKSIDHLVNDFIEKSWQRFSTGTKNDFIYISQIMDMINVMSEDLDCKSLLKPEEVKLLTTMINEKPLLRLYKNEVTDFLKRLVNYTSMTKFFIDRVGISQFNLQLLLETNTTTNTTTNTSTKKPSFNKPYSPYNLQNKQMSKSNDILNTSTPTKHFDDTLYPTRPYRLAGVDSGIALREKYINERDDHISLISRENIQLHTTSKEQKQAIQRLQRDYDSLKQYVDALELKLDSIPSKGTNRLSLAERNMIKDLLNQINTKDRTVQSLEQLCQQYQVEFQKLQNSPMINNLSQSLKRQDELISALKTKLKLNEGPRKDEEVKQFLLRLPFLKQYYMYFKYKQENKNFGTIILNVLTLILSTLLITSIIRIVYFVLLFMFNSYGSKLSPFSSYIYDNDTNWDKGEVVGITWWKEIEWLEYFMYNLEDWFNQ